MATTDSTTQFCLFTPEGLSKADYVLKMNVDLDLIRVELETGLVYGRTGKLLPGTPNKKGYLVVTLFYPIRLHKATVRLHRIIAYAAWGDLLFADGLEVNHINEIKTDNHLDNLGGLSLDIRE